MAQFSGYSYGYGGLSLYAGYCAGSALVDLSAEGRHWGKVKKIKKGIESPFLFWIPIFCITPQTTAW